MKNLRLDAEEMSRRFVISEGDPLAEAVRSLKREEQRILSLVVSRISPDDEDGKGYTFRISDIEELLTDAGNPNHDDKKRLEATTLEFMNAGLLIKGPNFQLSTSWFSSVQYRHTQNEVEFSFDPCLKPYFLALQRHIIRRAI